MSRYLLFAVLLMTGIALADDRPQHAASAAEVRTKAQAAQGQAEPAQGPPEKPQKRTGEAQAKTEAAQGRSEPALAQTEKPQRPAEEAQVKTEAVQGTAEPVQAQTEKAQGQTEEAQAKTEEDAKLISVPGGKALGMSILGNQDAPKSLVIVPWKTSELGRAPGISPMLDDSRQPVDKEVFMRALRYYEIRSESK